ncbi:MAG: hypothetical protein ACR2PA_20120 [Hyphomicrobiaceae bacterium]
MAPRAVRYAVLSGVVLLVGGAIYLLSVRGTAVLLDLAAGAADFLCL